MFVSLTFAEYTDATCDSVPRTSGVYCVYARDAAGHGDRLLYVGETDNLHRRLTDPHEHAADCHDRVGVGESLVCVCATAPERERCVAEAALIYKLQPPVNKEYKKTPPVTDVVLKVVATIAGLCGDHVIRRPALVPEVMPLMLRRTAPLTPESLSRHPLTPPMPRV